MEQSAYTPNTYQSKVSFIPLAESWKELEKGKPTVYSWLLEKMEADDVLSGVMEDRSQWKSRQDQVNELMQVLLPVNLIADDEIYVVTRPLNLEIVYSTASFKRIREQLITDEYIRETMPEMEKELKIAAVGFMLEKYCGKKLQGQFKPLINICDKAAGLNKYYEFGLNNMLVHAKGEPKGEAWNSLCEQSITRVNELIQQKELVEQVNLDEVTFEGITIVHIRDLTERTAVSSIKNILLDFHSISDEESFEKLRSQVNDLAGEGDFKMGIAPLFCINKKYVFPSSLVSRSYLLGSIESDEERQSIADQVQSIFKNGRTNLVVSVVNDESLLQYSFLGAVKSAGIESLVLYPLYQEEQLIGILEIGATKPNAITTELLNKFDPVAGMFELALQKTSDYFEGQINKIIKEQFTAIQPSVEWSFTDAAVDFLMRSEKEDDARVQPIVFNNVYPLYGAIDIRNSSVERNKAIQEDLLEQLSMVEKIIKMAIKIKALPRLKQAHYFIRKYRHAVQNIMLSEEESSVNRFLQVDIVQLFEFLKEKMPELTEDIDQYFREIASPVDMLYKHRKNFDDSISFLNTMLARFVDKEQRGAQEMYPHYFERFVTDGVDFNIYIGQSISPQEEFNDFYLKNIKVWQLSLLAKAAQIAKRWEEKIPVPLQTTQLILAHSYPISISFRQAERKFDVDGAYNIRYEIIKKRIDKVCIKDTNERLTQPGTVAIVYMHQQECAEYEGYIDFLRHEGMLEGETEHLELEELQGVSGLKAMRINVTELKDQEKKQERRVPETKGQGN